MSPGKLLSNFFSQNYDSFNIDNFLSKMQSAFNFVR